MAKPDERTDVERRANHSDPALAARAQNAWVDFHTSRVVERLRAAGVDGIVLKGPSLRAWLYGRNETRLYGDTDLLIAPDAWPAARDAVGEIGYALAQAEIPLDAPHHDEMWIHGEDAHCVELHRTIPGIAVSDEETWSRLSADAESMDLFGVECRILSRAGRLLNVCLHATHHQGAFNTAIEDLRRAADRAGRDEWEAAGRLAIELDAVPAFVSGLRSTDESSPLADGLSLPEAHDRFVAFLETDPTPGETSVALTARRFSSIDRWSTRLQFLWHKLFPPVAYMRDWAEYHDRATGPAYLVRAYLRRLVGIAPDLARGLMSWRRTKR